MFFGKETIFNDCVCVCCHILSLKKNDKSIYIWKKIQGYRFNFIKTCVLWTMHFEKHFDNKFFRIFWIFFKILFCLYIVDHSKPSKGQLLLVNQENAMFFIRINQTLYVIQFFCLYSFDYKETFKMTRLRFALYHII